MAILSLRLQQYRSYKDESFEFEPGVNIVVGPNASGKTNLLEALLVVGRGSSYRGQDKELIYSGKNWAKLEASANDHKRVVKLEDINAKIVKTIEIDDKIYKRLPTAQKLPTVLFEPNHLRLLSGPPERRRQLLDSLLEQTDPLYSATLKQYQRVLNQRNHLLKQPLANINNQIFVWDVRLSELANKLVQSRLKVVETINQQLPGLYTSISGTKDTVQLTYRVIPGAENYTSAILKRLQASLINDHERGNTSVGPHRDDLEIKLNNQDAQKSASRGELRTLLLAIKIIELRLVEETSGQKPLLLLDDVFSELDGARRQALTKRIKDHQTFITTTDADVVVQHFMDNCHIIPLG